MSCNEQRSPDNVDSGDRTDQVLATTDFLDVCCKAAELGGEQLLKHRSSFRTQEKGINDFVTDADLASQRAIHDHLLNNFPTHHFLGEEKIDLPMCHNTDSEFTWIVDPLDGTLNYVHQLQSYSVSIALKHRDRIIAAVVFDPWLKELYSATDSSQSTLNGEPISASQCENVQDALAVISLPGKVNPESPELASFLQLLYKTRSVRRLGSAALNLCYVAAGRLDAYWATCVKSWDIAAGALILQQAGGTIKDVSGEPLNLQRPRFVASSSETLNQQIREIVGQ